MLAAAGALVITLGPIAIWLLTGDPNNAVLLVALIVGAGVVGLTAWRPAIGCSLLVLGVPLTAGLGRGAVIPLLRLSEALTVLVAIGVVVHRVHARSRRPITGLDLAVGTFAIGVVAVASTVLLLARATPAGVDAWRTVLGPLQYLVIYIVFSRAALTSSQLRRVLHLAMVMSLVIAAVGLAQLVNVPGVRSFLEVYYPLAGTDPSICEFGVCRPTSLLEHWSAFGAYAMMFYTLALALAAGGRSGFSSKWLGIVMVVNAVAVLASQTQAAWLGIVVTTALILVHQRRAPRELILIGLAVLAGALLFLPQIQSRVLQQFGSTGSVSLQTPESLQTRLNYWGEVFLPAAAQSPWVGTGTVLPESVPNNLTNYADNEYLAMDFRAGLIGEVLLVVLLVTVAAIGWRARRHRDPLTRAIGAAAFADIIALAIMGATGEYLTFVGVSQVLWMTVALLPGGRAVQQGSPEKVATIIQAPHRSASASVGAASVDPRPTESRFRRLTRHEVLGSSALVFAGNAIARLLGLLFSLACARVLLPAEFGVLAYALVIATFGTFLVGNAPTGLARFLPRVRHDPAAKDAYFTNALVIVFAALIPSVVLIVPAGLAAGLSVSMTIGLVGNIVGTATYATYREAQRGQERFRAMVGFYIVANLAQLIAVLVAAALGYRSAALFLAVYGLSNFVALAVMWRTAPLGLRFIVRDVQWRRIAVIARFTWPLVVQTFLYLIWFGADLFLVKRLLEPVAAGEYAAAKTLVNFLLLAPMAIAGVAAPRIARIGHSDVRQYVMRILAIAVVTIGVCLLATIAIEHRAIAILFGAKYAAAAGPFAILAVGMSIYGIYLMFETSCVALGKTLVDPIATGVGMVTTIVVGILVIPQAGITGAAIAFTLGAIAQVAVIAPYTFWLLRVMSNRDLYSLEYGRPLLADRPQVSADEVWSAR